MTIGDKMPTSAVEEMKDEHTMLSARNICSVDAFNSLMFRLTAISITLDCNQPYSKGYL